MENDEFEKFCIKNYTCYYFHDKTKFEDSDIDNISTVKKSYENILIYKISYNTLIGLNHLRIRFNNMEGFIRVYEGTRYLVIFGSENYDASFNMIRYQVFNYDFSHYYVKVKVDSYDSLTIEKTLTLHNVIKVIGSVLNKDQNHY